jgi:hypothetical protein
LSLATLFGSACMGWQVVGLTTKKQLFLAPLQAIILMREVEAPLP